MLKKSKNGNVNYLAKIIKLSNIRKHSNADKLQCTIIDGNNVIIGLDNTIDEIGVYFPIESKINLDFLKFHSLLKDKTLNKDVEKAGFFETTGRVRIQTLRGEKSEGFWLPIQNLFDFVGSEFKFEINEEFDMVNDKLFVEKYIPINQISTKSNDPKLKGKKTKKVESRLVEGQFAFHHDTSNFGKNIYSINPDDDIIITNKLHGTSAVFSKVLTKRKLPIKDRIGKFLKMSINEHEYGNIYSSRKVIKNDILRPLTDGFYKTDVWGDVNNEIQHFLKDGMIIYGEIVGYTKEGRLIQGKYDYGMEHGKNKLYIYRITTVSITNHTFEWTWSMIKLFCQQNGLNYVPEMYVGKAGDLFKDLIIDDEWHNNFLTKLKDKYLEKHCDICLNKVWAEGIVIRKETLTIQSFKLKSFNFMGDEAKLIDKGEIDIETSESIEQV